MTLFLRIAAVLTLLAIALVAAVQFSSLSWPGTVATVQQAGWDSELDLAHKGGSDYHVRYSYQVAGKKYENGWISFGSGVSVLHIINTKEDRQPREDDQVMAYYAPFYPGFSVLIPGPASNLWLWAVGAFLVAVLFWTGAIVVRDPVI